jgi:NAD(P)-dependent dehydrogenase (short-subunit alcohol dehydrogenase family)
MTSHDHSTAAQIPDLTGRLALVTGANAGVGFETARALAQHGASVVLACRDMQQAEDALRHIRLTASYADVTVMQLDLASLESVRGAAEQLRASHDRLDLLIDNAGVGWVPYTRTADALAILRAAVDPQARGGEYYAPSRMMELKGYPARRESSRASHDLADARRLWEISEKLSGVTYSVPV